MKVRQAIPVTSELRDISRLAKFDGERLWRSNLWVEEVGRVLGFQLHGSFLLGGSSPDLSWWGSVSVQGGPRLLEFSAAGSLLAVSVERSSVRSHLAPVDDVCSFARETNHDLCEKRASCAPVSPSGQVQGPFSGCPCTLCVCTNQSTEQWGPAAPKSPHRPLLTCCVLQARPRLALPRDQPPSSGRLTGPSLCRAVASGFWVFTVQWQLSKPGGTYAVTSVELGPSVGSQAGGRVRPCPTRLRSCPRAPGREFLRVTSRSGVSALCPRRGGGLRAAQQQAGQVQRDAVLEGEQVPAEQPEHAAAGLRAAQHRVVLRPGGVRG